MRVSYNSKDKRPWEFSNLTWYPEQRFIHSLTTQSHTFISLRVSDCYEDERTTLVCIRYSKHRIIHSLSFAMVGHWYVTLFSLQHKKHKINSLRVSNYDQDERPWLSSSPNWYAKHRCMHSLGFTMVGHWYVSLFTLQHKSNTFISLRVSNYSKDERPCLFSYVNWHPKHRFSFERVGQYPDSPYKVIIDMVYCTALI